MSATSIMESEEAVGKSVETLTLAAQVDEAKPSADSEPKLWTPLFAMILAATLCAFIVAQGVNAGSSVYVDITGGSSTLAGVGAAVFSAAAALTRLVAGPVVDNKGRIIVMGVGCALLIMGTLGPVFVTKSSLFMLWRFLQGAGFSAATTASATAAADVLPMSRLGEGIGYHGLGQALAMAIGPALALFLVHTDPAENLYLGLSAAAILSLSLTVFCRYEKNPFRLPETSAYRMRWEERQVQREAFDNIDRIDQENDQDPIQQDSAHESEGKSTADASSKPTISLDSFFEKRALPGAIPIMLTTPAYGFSIYFAGVLASSLGITNAGVYYTLSAVSMIIVRLSSKKFMDTVAPIKLVTVATMCGLTWFGMLFAVSVQAFPTATEWIFYLAGLPYGLLLGITMPVNQTVAVKNTPPDRWGATNALYLLSIDVGYCISSIVFGIINDSLGYTVSLVCVLAFLVIAYIASWICYPARDKKWR